MHEALVGGCLRIFDDEFLPSYRDEAHSGIGRNWRLAVVKAVQTHGEDAGRPLSLTLCADHAFVKSEVLDRAFATSTSDGSGQLRTGTRWATPDRHEDRNNRPIFPNSSTFTPDAAGDWILVLTDGRARSEQPRGSGYIPYFCTLGKVTGGSELTGLTNQAWSDFQFSARDARDFTEALRGTREADLRQAEVAATQCSRAAQQPSWDVQVDGVDLPRPVHTGDTPQTAGYRPIGWRPPHRPWLFPGQPVWVKVDETNQVTALKPSIIWRHTGAGPAGARVPAGLHACTAPASLCPSCILFGSADTDEREETTESRQRSYRGHVRVGDWTPTAPVAPETLDLAPMGTPRPGSGQFYLDTPPGAALPENKAPHSLREWGADADAKTPRRLRGRKHYWRTGDRAVRPRWRQRPHQSEGQMASRAEAFPTGTRFTGSLWFEGLTAGQIGELLACLTPAEVLAHTDDETLVFTVGGGKPFGFGACTVTATLAEVHDAESRWLGGDPPALTAADALAAFRASSPTAHSTWPALAKAVTLDAVDTDEVWYPPGAGWGQVGSKDFDGGYEFWKQSVGRKQAQPPHKELIQLPAITEAVQSLPIIRRGGR